MAELSAGQAKRATVDLKKILAGVPTHAECGMGGALMKWKELAKRIMMFARRFFGGSEVATASRETADSDLSAADEHFIEPEEGGYLQYWRDGLKCKVELLEGYTSFGRPGGTWRGDSLPDESEKPRESGDYALFNRDGDIYTVFGAGDKAKIFVRGEPLKYNDSEELNSGDKIRVGNCEAVFLRRSCPTVTVGGGKV